MPDQATKAASPSFARNGSIRLPMARLEQLKLIAEKMNLSVTDTIGVFIRQQIEAGLLSPEIPGVVLRVEDEDVWLGFGDQRPVKMNRQDALRLVGDIRARLSGTELLQGIYGFMDAQRPNFDFNKVRVERRGKGIVVYLNGQKKPFSNSSAADLADLIEKSVS